MNSAGHFLRITLLAAAGVLTACGGSLDDARTPTGSTSVVADSSYQALLTANPDQGTISRLDLASGTVTEIEVGLEPVRIARAGDLYFATLRGERAVAVLSETDGQLRLDERIELGAEPYGVVADEAGSTVWVANQLGGTVSEIDVATRTVTREFAVAGQPRFLALHPSGRHLYVGGALPNALADIDLRTGEVNAVGLPENTGMDPETFEPVVLSGRVTGDLSVASDGTALAVPTLYVNNVSPVGAPNPDDVGEGGGGYAGGNGTRRFNGGVVLIVTNANGNLRTEYTDTLSLGGFGGNQSVTGYPSAVAFTPDTENLVVTLEGADAALVLDVPDSIGQQSAQNRRFASMEPEFFGSTMTFASTATVMTGSAPRGVAFLAQDQAFVHNGFDYSVADLQLSAAVDQISGNGDFLGGGGVAVDMPAMDFEDEGGFDSSEFDLRTADAVPVSDEILSDELAEGRRLFFSTSNPSMALPGAGVSCASCHFDVRNDGLTWQFVEGSRQTPSLAGNVSETAPVTWTDSVPTVFDEVLITSQGRMGGQGLEESEAALVAAFVDSTPLPDTPMRGANSDAVQRGKALFESAEVGCADCHSGETYSDDEPYDMFGLSNVRTRSLRGIAASAPYLHDGSAPTLRAVLVAVRDGEMGDTGGLSDADIDDLEAYLLSL